MHSPRGTAPIPPIPPIHPSPSPPCPRTKPARRDAIMPEASQRRWEGAAGTGPLTQACPSPGRGAWEGFFSPRLRHWAGSGGSGQPDPQRPAKGHILHRRPRVASQGRCPRAFPIAGKCQSSWPGAVHAIKPRSNAAPRPVAQEEPQWRGRGLGEVADFPPFYKSKPRQTSTCRDE